ncbi:hypothetical protein ZWY2020_053491 [Hordeum vulgare]|nr:hypothetical protein ZWY2020_053491 [Hordeum vulgare]
MVQIGDLSLWPAKRHAVVSATQDMDVQVARLATQAVIVWLGGIRPRVSMEEIRLAIAEHFCLDCNCFKVKPHLPEDFLVTVDFPHHRDLVVASPNRFDKSSLDVHLAKCRLCAHAEAVNAFHHVRLCVENVALLITDKYRGSQ